MLKFPTLGDGIKEKTQKGEGNGEEEYGMNEGKEREGKGKKEE